MHNRAAMFRAVLVTLAFSLSLLSAATADAKTVNLAAEGVTATVPDGWQVGSADGMTLAIAPSQEASVVFASRAIRKVNVAYKRLGGILDGLVGKATLESPERSRVNGMDALEVSGSASTDDGEIEIRALVMAGPRGRAVYAIALVGGERASKYDRVIDKIFGSLSARGTGGASGAAKASPKENRCWEFKSQPNGWKRRSFGGVSYLIPRGWSAKRGRDPDTDEAFLTITGKAGAVVLFAQSAGAQAAWQSAKSQLAAAYGLGAASWGSVHGARAICARGAGQTEAGRRFTSDAVVIEIAGGSLVAAGQVTGSPSEMRAILGSLRAR